MRIMTMPGDYQLAPFACTVCGGQNVPAIDFHRDLTDDDPNRLTSLYVCHQCITDAARELTNSGGWSFEVNRVGELAAEQVRADQAEADAAALRGERDDWRTRVLAIRDAAAAAGLMEVG